MSQQPETWAHLEPDLADRMRKALRVADLGVTQMAEYLDVSRNSVGNWINGRIVPTTQTLRLWAMRTGVPFEWLRDGQSPRPVGPGGGSAVVLPRLDSNQQPSD